MHVLVSAEFVLHSNCMHVLVSAEFVLHSNYYDC